MQGGVMELQAKRQHFLLNLLESQEFRCQKELASALTRKGFDVTQSSISRDFKKLGIIKIAGRYVPANRAVHATLHQGASELVIHLEPVGPHLVVVRTKTGAANVVARELDLMPGGFIAGTVAGDDTIFVATKTKAAQTNFINALNLNTAQ